MGTAQRYLSLEVCYFLIFSCLVHLAQPSPACSIRNRDAEYRFQVLGRCFEHIGRRTWERCADHCQSSGGVMAKIDEHTITEDTAPKFAKIMEFRSNNDTEDTAPKFAKFTEFRSNNDVLVGFRVGWGGAEWMDGTTVTVPDVDMMMPSLCGWLYIDDDNEEITYFWMALPCEFWGHCVCEYAPDTTADVHADETAGVGATTTGVPAGQTPTTVPGDATTTTLPLHSTTLEVPVDQTTASVSYGKTTEQIRRPQTIYVKSKEAAYIIGEAMSESRCRMVTKCTRICHSNSQCVRFNYNKATEECRLFDYNTDQRFKDHPDWTVWDKMSKH